MHQRNADTAFSGEGSRKRGSRWTRRGHRVVYASESLSLATLEILVHGVTHHTLKKFVCIDAGIPKRIIAEVGLNNLPSNWRDDPPPMELQEIGDEWMKTKSSCVLKVPSSIIPNEFNFIINPDHPDFAKVRIGDVSRWASHDRLGE